MQQRREIAFAALLDRRADLLVDEILVDGPAHRAEHAERNPARPLPRQARERERRALPWWLGGATFLITYQSIGSQAIYDTPEKLAQLRVTYGTNAGLVAFAGPTELLATIGGEVVFEAADVLKKLTFLSHEKKLSFREQTLLEKAKFLIVSEITNAEAADEAKLRAEIDLLVEAACKKHLRSQPRVMSAAVH